MPRSRNSQVLGFALICSVIPGCGGPARQDQATAETQTPHRTTARPPSANECEQLAVPDKLPAEVTVGMPLTDADIEGLTSDGSADTYSVLLATRSKNARDQWNKTKAKLFVDCTQSELSRAGLIDADSARRAGYVHWGSSNNSHLISSTCVLDDVALRTSCPESIVISGDEIVGAMFIASTEFAEAVNPSGSQGVWHLHRSDSPFCLGAGLTYLQKPSNGTCAIGAAVNESPPMMHVTFSGPAFDSDPSDGHVHDSGAHDSDMGAMVIE